MPTSQPTGPPQGWCLLAWGSRGDVQPFVALGRGLRATGASVAVAAADDFEPMVRRAGLEFESLGWSSSDLLGDPVVRRWLTESSASLRAELRHMGAVVRTFRDPAVEALSRLAPRHEAFVSGVLTADTLASVAPRLGRRHAIGMLAPMVPSRSPEASLMPVVRRPSLLNRLAGGAGGLGMLRLSAAIRHGVEDALGLERRTLREQLAALHATTTVVGASPSVVPPAPDWGPHVRVTGWWQLSGEAGWSLPPPAQAAADGGRLVHVGLGSMPVRDGERLAEVVRAALERLDLVATVQGDWSGALAGHPRVVPLGDVPHDRLFASVSVVVHHGGAGTTGTAFAAGVPQVVVPHMGDQPYWGRRVAQLGCGPDPVALHHLDAGRLVAALRQAREPAAVAAAARLGRRVAAEDGVAQAVAHLTRG